jgi:exopolysaccharide production protein ExoY
LEVVQDLNMDTKGVETGEGFEAVRSGKGSPPWKRGLDLLVILVLSPFVLAAGLAVALIIRLGSKGPIFFHQKRVGFQGRHFTCYKFRTMRVNAETETHRLHTQNLIKSSTPMVKLDAHKDPRLVPCGALLRASGLDELPQLLNVLRGEMSLVGPRPCIPYEYENYEPWHRRRFDAVPGLTGLWQVSGKNRTTFDQMVQLDIAYAHKRSLWLDLKIMAKTFSAIWSQYLDLRSARKEQVPPSAGLRNPLESFRL